MCIGKGTKVVGMEGNDRCFETFVNPGRVKLASSRSLGWNCRSQSFECKMYITEQAATEFESASPETAAIKLAKYGKERRSVGLVM
jgi:hypothetical protein